MIVYELTENAILVNHHILTWCVTNKIGLVTRSVVEASFTGMLEKDDISVIVTVDEIDYGWKRDRDGQYS